MAARILQSPALKASITSCVCMAAGDLLCQRLTSQRESTVQSIAWDRTARFGIVGCTLHGPFFNWGFSALDRFIGRGNDMRTVCTKVVTGQFTLFPAYLSAFFMYMSFLEGKGLKGGLQRIQDCFLPTALTGMCFWPVANAINFRFIPPSPGKRLAYVNAAGIIWNVFLSWENSMEHKANQKPSWVSALEERSKRHTVEHL